MTRQAHIKVDPKIAFGKPVVAGTRIPVYMVLELAASVQPGSGAPLRAPPLRLSFSWSNAL